MVQWQWPGGVRSPRGCWRKATVAFLTLLPAAFFLQFVAVYNRHSLASGIGGGDGGGNDAGLAAASDSPYELSTNERGGGGGGGSALAGATGVARSDCRPLAELGAVAAAAAVNGTVLLTVFNAAMLDLARNWLEHAVRGPAGIRNAVAGCADGAAGSLAAEYGVPCVDLGPYLADAAAAEAHEQAGDWGRPKDGYEWGAAAWKRMAWAKTVLLPAAMRHGGVSVAWSDVDVVWFRDPTPLLAAHPEVDVIMGSDHLGTSLAAGDAGFEEPEFAFWHEYNSGAMLWRRGKAVQRLLDAWTAEQYAGNQKYDQDALNRVLLRPGINESDVAPHIPAGQPRTLLVAGRALRLGAMPVSRFMTGRTFFTQRLHEIRRVRPYSAHLTWVLSGREGKVARLRETGFWRGDAPGAPYAADGRYLSVDVAWPPVPFDANGVPFGNWTAARSWDMEAYGLAAVDFQLGQLYYGVQLAIALRRTLILPKMACFCDNNWWPGTGCRSVPTAEEGGDPLDFPLPFACPFDFLFVAQNFASDPKQFGPPLRHRYHTFLSEPALPAVVQERQAVVQTSPELRCSGRACRGVVAEPCDPRPRYGKAAGARQPPTLCVPARLTDKQLGRVLAPLEQERVLHFADAHEAWGGFTNSRDQKAADARAEHLVTNWQRRDSAMPGAVPPGRGAEEDYILGRLWDRGAVRAIANGSLPVTEILRHRPFSQWDVDASGFRFMGDASIPRV